MKLDPIEFWQKLKGTVLVNDAIYDRSIDTISNQKRGLENNHNIFDIRPLVHDNEFHTSLEFVLSCTRNFKFLFRQIFIDFDRYDLKNTSSVGPKHSHAICEYDKRYIILGEIDLFSHTMNVVLKMIEITRELPQSTRDICILLALLHDVGKSEIAKKEHQQEAKNEDKHHKISANYAKSLIQNRIFALDDDINHDLQELVYNCLNKHHDKDENEHNIFLELLKKADFSARDDEYAEIIFKRKKILELKERKKQ